MVKNISIDDGIAAVRAVLPKCWFDADKCSQGLKALHQYQKEWDDKGQCFKDYPLHDWSSHAADAFRYFAISSKNLGNEHGGERWLHRKNPNVYIPNNDFDVFARDYGQKSSRDWDPFGRGGE